MTSTFSPHRDPRPASVRIRTMRDSIKIYEVSDWWIDDGVLCLVGINSESNHSSKFFYPICNMEHFNIDEFGETNEE